MDELPECGCAFPTPAFLLYTFHEQESHAAVRLQNVYIGAPIWPCCRHSIPRLPDAAQISPIYPTARQYAGWNEQNEDARRHVSDEDS